MISSLSSAFFSICTKAIPRERVVRCLESLAVGLMGLRIVISSHQPLDCWGSASLELPAVGLPELRRA